MRQFDVLIIGAGAVGNAIAREISKNNRISVAVLEKEPDTAFGISGRNSGVLHAGFNNKPGSLMAKLCVQGSEDFENQAKSLRIEYKKTGKLIVARYPEDLERLNSLKKQGEDNGVRELRILGQEEVKKLVGYDAGVGALWSGMTGIFDPFEYTVALAEAAYSQGTEFFFGRQVMEIKAMNGMNGMQGDQNEGRCKHQQNNPHPHQQNNPHLNQQGNPHPHQQINPNPHKCKDRHQGNLERGFLITAENCLTGGQETFHANILINSAGLYADAINRMLGLNDYNIFPCRGEYHILDKNQSKEMQLPVYPIPNEKDGGLGVHLTPTIGGNLMIGPSAEYLSQGQKREDYSTTLEVMEQLSEEGTDLFPSLDNKAYIRSFSGVRPKLVPEEEGGYSDFVIESCENIPGFIRLIGIESPGLTASIPIGKMVTKMVEEIQRGAMVGEMQPCAMVNEMKTGAMADEMQPYAEVLPEEEVPAPYDHKRIHVDHKDHIINTFDHKRDKGDQKMLCRCEGITEEAVLSAYDRILAIGAIPTIKGLKNRTRVTMGNCQGSFCSLNIVELLQKKRQLNPMHILWNGFGSHMFEGGVRE